MAPVAMVNPRSFLAVFTAVLGAATASAFGKLALEFLPLAALVVRTLTNAASRLILAAEVSHDHAGPVLHVLRVVPNGELLNQGEDIDIIGQQVLILILELNRGRRVCVVIKEMQFPVDLESRHQVRALEIRSQVAVLGYISQELQRHQDILISGHSGENALSRWCISVAEVHGVGTRGKSWGVRVVWGLSRGKAQPAVGLRGAVIVDDAPVNRRSMGDVESLGILTL